MEITYEVYLVNESNLITADRERENVISKQEALDLVADLYDVTAERDAMKRGWETELAERCRLANILRHNAGAAEQILNLAATATDASEVSE